MKYVKVDKAVGSAGFMVNERSRLWEEFEHIPFLTVPPHLLLGQSGLQCLPSFKGRSRQLLLQK